MSVPAVVFCFNIILPRRILPFPHSLPDSPAAQWLSYTGTTQSCILRAWVKFNSSFQPPGAPEYAINLNILITPAQGLLSIYHGTWVLQHKSIGGGGNFDVGIACRATCVSMIILFHYWVSLYFIVISGVFSGIYPSPSCPMSVCMSRFHTEHLHGMASCAFVHTC